MSTNTPVTLSKEEKRKEVILELVTLIKHFAEDLDYVCDVSKGSAVIWHIHNVLNTYRIGMDCTVTMLRSDRAGSIGQLDHPDILRDCRNPETLDSVVRRSHSTQAI